MKKLFGTLLATIFIWPCLSFDKEGLLNHPIPLLPFKTLDGKIIDDNYYKGHVTIVSFMYIGCVPCMNEISILNKINQDFGGNQQLQILCVARQMKEQMIAFNANNETLYSNVRKGMGTEPIKYSIQPTCNDAKSKMDTLTSNHLVFHTECTTIEDIYNITAYPTIFYVDKKGLVRKIHTSGPGTKGDTSFYEEIKKEIEPLLAE